MLYTMIPWAAIAVNLPWPGCSLLVLLHVDPQQKGRLWVLFTAEASPFFAGRGRVSWFTLAEASIAQG